MTFDLRLEGGPELKAALDRMTKAQASKVDRVVQRTAAELEAGIKLQIQQGPKTGKIYQRGNVVHQASAPGQAPASDTGVLMGSITHEREGEGRAAVMSRTIYAAFLEFGTRKMAPRPAWLPEIEDAREPFLADLRKALR